MNALEALALLLITLELVAAVVLVTRGPLVLRRLYLARRDDAKGTAK